MDDVMGEKKMSEDEAVLNAMNTLTQEWMSANPQLRILLDIAYERKRQDLKWREQNHHPAYWFAILMEEVGEVARELVENLSSDSEHLREELIQTAAVCVVWVECMDRQPKEGDEDG